MALTGILGDVTRERVSGVLYERDPELLNSDVPAEVAAYEALVRGAAVSVVLLTGLNPPLGSIRDLAVEAIALETGSAIEYAEYPEQQVQGEDGRGYYLHQRYLEKLADLRGIIAALPGGVIPDDGEPIRGGTGLPRARMPAPLPYPDPVLVRNVSYVDTRARWEHP
jgi:hypothetical protein